MRKNVFVLMSSVLLLSSCGSYMGEGAYTGGNFGAILGSAIGGISGGARGSDIGTIVGMVGGAAIGAAVGNAHDKALEARYDRRMDNIDQVEGTREARISVPSDYDVPGNGDDRIIFSDEDSISGPATMSKDHDVNTSVPTVSVDRLAPGYSMHLNPLVELRNVQFNSPSGKPVIYSKDVCTITFEIMNNSQNIQYDIQPTVVDITRNKYIQISPNIHVESIAPNKGVRYTATILANKRLKDGSITLRIAVAQGNNQVVSQVKEIKIATYRRR